MNLSTDVKTHAIITYTKTHYLINAKQHEALKTLGGGEEIVIEGNRVKGNNIADIMTIEKYYETYPAKRPEQPSRNFSQELRDLEEKKQLERKSYPKGGLLGKVKEQSWWMDSTIEVFKKDIEKAKAKGEPYEGKVKSLGLMEASRLKKYGLKVNKK